MKISRAIKGLALLVLTGMLVLATGCQSAQPASFGGHDGTGDANHPRHATGIASHVSDL